MWTLNQALQECARNTYNTSIMIRFEGSDYVSTGLAYARRFASGINAAMRKIARETIGPESIETITTNDKGIFYLADLDNTCLRVRAILLDDRELLYFSTADNGIFVDGYPSTEVKVVYEYLPDELDVITDLDVEIDLPETYVDPRTLCQYANYTFLNEEGTDYDSARAQVWLTLFNDSFQNIENTNKKPRRVRYTG